MTIYQFALYFAGIVALLCIIQFVFDYIEKKRRK